MSIPDDVRIPLVAAAAAGAGSSSDPGWSDRVADAALELFLMADPNSPLSKRLATVADAKKYVATVVGVGKKKSHDGRVIDKGLVQLQGKPSAYHADGIEFIQTDWLNTAEGQSVYEKAGTLVGHRVLVYANTETFTRSDGVAAKSKTLVHLTDLGEDKFDGNSNPAPDTAPQGVPYYTAGEAKAMARTSNEEEPPY